MSPFVRRRQKTSGNLKKGNLMAIANPPRLMLVAPASGGGKTTVTCALLKALKNRMLEVASFKCGPDYIDPTFHSKVIGAKSRNLDIFMCGEEGVRFLLAKNAEGCDFSLIEGVMGMYDGKGFSSEYASSNHLSQLTSCPQILVVNVKGMSLSVLPLISGFLGFKKNNIKGIIFNCCSKGSYQSYKTLVEDELKIKVYGYMPYIKEASIESRHLGLITADELLDINAKLDILSNNAEETIDITGLLELSKQAEPFEYTDLWQELSLKPALSKVKIAVARDNAFSFIYEDNIDILKKLGAEIVYFSPINDKILPQGINGLLLYGGYPEEYAYELSANKEMRISIKAAIEHGIPTIAECGGFMYLQEQITLGEDDPISFEMVGAITGGSHMTKKLSRFGYVTLTSKEDNLLFKKDESINAHEFHYSNSNNNGTDLTATKNNKEWDCIHATDKIFAGYPHLHFACNIKIAKRFIEKCKEGTI